ncbi:hypothetical protein ACFLQR_03420 [Verrucomicrobiota bacterium]
MHTTTRQSGSYSAKRIFILLMCVIALFLIIFGSKLWLIREFGSDLPYWDQWRAEAGDLLIPWANKSLSIGAFFKPHNEHRIVFTRLLSMTLVMLNQQWDARLATVVNAGIHSLSAVILLWLMVRLIGPRALGPGLLAIALTFSLPFSWENTLAAFQSQFYFLFLFSLIAIALLVLNRPMSIAWLAGLVVGLACIFTMAAGLLAVCAVFLLVILRTIRGRLDWKAGAVTLIGCAVIIIIGLLLTVTVEGHDRYRTHSIITFVTALGRNLAWPNTNYPWLALLNVLPLALLAFHYMRSRQTDLRAEEMTLALGLWVILEAAATAYARGGNGTSVSWRYMDILSLGMVVSAFSIVLLTTRYKLRGRMARIRPAVFAAWAVLCVIGLTNLSSEAVQTVIPHRKTYYDLQVAHTKAFVATDDIRHLENKNGEEIPYPCPYYLAGILRNPVIRELLPASVRQPLPVRRKNTNDTAFVQNGVDTETPCPEEFEVAWGSWSQDGYRAEGVFESLPVRRSSLPCLKFRLSGFLGHNNLEMKLVDLSQDDEKILRPAVPPLSTWMPFSVKAPDGDFIIVASDSHHNAWFAFKAPTELGYLSWLAERLANRGPFLLVLGILIVLFMGAKEYLANLAVTTQESGVRSQESE